jgi:hypothetical protein
MTASIRKHVERLVIRTFLRDALTAGYAITVDNGEDFEIENSTNRRDILKALFTSDEDLLHVMKGPKRVGWVRCVYGSGGWDVISDFSTNLKPIMAGAERMADRFS